jgi:hypothetical protein
VRSVLTMSSLRTMEICCHIRLSNGRFIASSRPSGTETTHVVYDTKILLADKLEVGLSADIRHRQKRSEQILGEGTVAYTRAKVCSSSRDFSFTYSSSRRFTL